MEITYVGERWILQMIDLLVEDPWNELAMHTL